MCSIEIFEDVPHRGDVRFEEPSGMPKAMRIPPELHQAAEGYVYLVIIIIHVGLCIPTVTPTVLLGYPHVAREVGGSAAKPLRLSHVQNQSRHFTSDHPLPSLHRAEAPGSTAYQQPR